MNKNTRVEKVDHFNRHTGDFFVTYRRASFHDESCKLPSEKPTIQESVIKITLTSNDGFAGGKLQFADESEVLG